MGTEWALVDDEAKEMIWLGKKRGLRSDQKRMLSAFQMNDERIVFFMSRDERELHTFRIVMDENAFDLLKQGYKEIDKWSNNGKVLMDDYETPYGRGDLLIVLELDDPKFCNGCNWFMLDNGYGTCKLGFMKGHFPHHTDNSKPVHKSLMFRRPFECTKGGDTATPPKLISEL